MRIEIETRSYLAQKLALLAELKAAHEAAIQGLANSALAQPGLIAPVKGGGTA